MPVRFINPNFHVILVHYPLGVFVLGVVLELIGFLWRRSSLRTASRWMIVLGALLSIPAAASGIFALKDVQKQGIDAARYVLLRDHVLFMSIGTIVAVFCAVVGLGASDAWRRRLYLPLLIGCVAAWQLMVIGAWNAGESVYRQGSSILVLKTTTVTDDNDKDVIGPDGKVVKITKYVPLKNEDPAKVMKEHPERSYENAVRFGDHDIKKSIQDKDYKELTSYYAGTPVQHHIIAAGLAFGVAFLALGLAMRRVHANTIVREAVIAPAAARPNGGSRETPRRVTDDMSVIRSFNSDIGMAPKKSQIASGRVWLLTTLLALGAFGLGYWCATGQDVLTPDGWNHFMEQVKAPAEKAAGQTSIAVNRTQIHVILGAAFVVLLLICALLAVAAPKKGWMLAFFSFLLIAVISAQTWVGLLLTYDREGSTLTKFSWLDESSGATPTTAPTTQPSAPTSAPAVPTAAADVPAPKESTEAKPAPASTPAPTPAPVPTPAPAPSTDQPAPKEDKKAEDKKGVEDKKPEEKKTEDKKSVDVPTPNPAPEK